MMSAVLSQRYWLLVLLLFVLLFLAINRSSEAQAQQQEQKKTPSKCYSNRPGWAHHRTLYVSSNFYDSPKSSESFDSWVKTLCCVYIYIKLRSPNASILKGKAASLKTYAGDIYPVEGSFTNFDEIAIGVMDDVCSMSMGSSDCEKKAACVKINKPAEESNTIAPTTTNKNDNDEEERNTIASTTIKNNDDNDSLSDTKNSAEESKTIAPTTTNYNDIDNNDSLLDTIQSCNSNRPNSWADHRTLKIPSSFLEGEENNDDTLIQEWSNKLCCVYTHVQIMDNDASQVRFEVYDGSSYTIRGSSFVDVAEKAYGDICGMSMGSQDCYNQRECIADTEE